MTQVAEPEARKYVGGGVLRKEDRKLVLGESRFIDDISVAGMLWMAFVRSPIAHGRIKSVDTSAATAMPGVVAVYTGADLASEWAGGLPCAWPVTADIKLPTHWPVAQDKVRYAGDAVAVVVADSREHAVDAVGAVDADYEQLEAVLDLEGAIADGALCCTTTSAPTRATRGRSPTARSTRSSSRRRTSCASVTGIRAWSPTRSSRGACWSCRSPSAASSPSTPRRRSRTSCGSCWR